MRIEFEIVGENGLHARPAAALARLASSCSGNVQIEMGATIVNAKSIMGLLTLAAAQGARLALNVEGSDNDEQEADKILGMLESEGIAQRI